MTQKGTATELGNQPIGKLLTQYAIPAIIAMTASSLYNMVDSIFIGHGVGAMAISGLAITFPLMNLAAAFGSLVGVGASTLVSVKLGQKDYSTAQQILGNVVSLNLIIGILFTILTLAFLDPILYFFGASEVTLPYARDYMVTILLGNVVTHMYLGLNSVLRSAGHPQKAMAATILTVVINILLDPLFIYGFGMGIRGAAIATILAQIISLCWLIKIFCNKNELLHFRRGIYRLKGVLVERSLLYDSNSDQQRAETVRRRPCHRSLRYSKPNCISFRNDCHGVKPRYATYCRIQFRGTSISSGKPCNETDRHSSYDCHHQRFSGRRTDAGTCCIGFYNRQQVDRTVRTGTPNNSHVLPDYRIPDGNI